QPRFRGVDATALGDGAGPRGVLAVAALRPVVLDHGVGEAQRAVLGEEGSPEGATSIAVRHVAPRGDVAARPDVTQIRRLPDRDGATERVALVRAIRPRAGRASGRRAVVLEHEAVTLQRDAVREHRAAERVASHVAATPALRV